MIGKFIITRGDTYSILWASTPNGTTLFIDELYCVFGITQAVQYINKADKSIHITFEDLKE